MVYVSLRTLFNADASFYQDCFQAFADAPFEVILSTGTVVKREQLGNPPANFIVASHVPQVEVLQRVRVFVTHGGMNSVSESLSSGVPMLVVPQMSEQHIVGRQVASVGAGICLKKEAVTPELLRTSIQQLLHDDSFRSCAAIVQQSFLKAGGVTRAADAIFAFTRPSLP